MKVLLVLAGALMWFHSGATALPPHSSFGVSFGIFYSSLDPHGEWIMVDRDVYAWRPSRTMHGWRPYTVGRWAWTDDGWYWISEEPWGWATYHYGRWYYDDFYGWLWTPGYDWAPAWVEWRYGGDYVGWAPLGPYAVFSIHSGIHYARHWSTPHHWWSFVDCGRIGSPSVHRYVYRQEDNRRYVSRTRSTGSVRYTNDRIVTRGPDREYVERRGKVRIDRAEVVGREDHGERIVRADKVNRIETYRPRFDSRGDEARERPGRIRESEHKVDLDANRIDGRLQRGGDADDMLKRDQGRVSRETDTPQRAVKQHESGSYKRDTQMNGPRPHPQKETLGRGRGQREETRSSNPERTMRRTEPDRERPKREAGSSRERGKR